jgi:CubicO group peptidase (beta-lactamase class C family)
MAYGKPLSAWWPEFAGDGKEKITLGLALGYRTGMSHAFPKGVSGVKDRCDWRRICELAAKEKPVDEPGTVQKYLSMSYGWIIGRPLELAMRKPLNEILLEEVLRPCAIEDEFYFAADDGAIGRTATVYKSESFESMNDDRLRRMCLPSAFAVANARSIARFYNRLCGFDGCAPLVSRKTLDMALKPCRHESDPLPPSEKLDRDWHMVFGMGYGLWGGSSDISRVFGHGGIGGSEGLCDRSKRLTVGFTCNFGKDVRKVRSKLYGIVGMKWRYWDDAEADIQNLQMRTMK